METTSRAKCVIFDFDGVLADSFDALYRLNALAMREINLPFNRKIYKKWFEGNIHAAIRNYISDEQKLEQLKSFKQEHFRKFYEQAHLFSFTPEYIKKLPSPLYVSIVSSTKSEFIEALLSSQSLRACFKQVLGSGTESKVERFKSIMKISGASAGKTFFVTDTAGDIAEGKTLGLITIAVTWGFHGEETLRAAAPHKLISSPEKLFALFL